MSNEVYANGREVSCKAANGKSICAFPDVCLTPPSPPAGPIPIPYPNTGMASDTDGGSKTVQISGQEVMLKDSSDFKKSTGDEAATKSQGMNVITHQIQGKCYFTSWSMDVKIEGENAVRHLDMMTHNHASTPGGTPPWPYMDAMAVSADPCATEKANEVKACKNYKPYGNKDMCEKAGLSGPPIQKNVDAQALGFHKSKDWAADVSEQAASNECVSARRCKLVPYDGAKNGVDGCCPSQTPDHVVPKSSFYTKSVKDNTKLAAWTNYKDNVAPCVCEEGANNTAGTHGLRHAYHKANSLVGNGKYQSFDEEVKLCVEGVISVFKSLLCSCTSECLKAQVMNGHKNMGNLNAQVKHSPSGSKMSNAEITEQAAELKPTNFDVIFGGDSDLSDGSDLSDMDTD